MYSLLLACLLLEARAGIRRGSRSAIELCGSRGKAEVLDIDTGLGPISVYGIETETVRLCPGDNITANVPSTNIFWTLRPHNQSRIIQVPRAIGRRSTNNVATDAPSKITKIIQIEKDLWVTFFREIDMMKTQYNVSGSPGYSSKWITLYLGKVPALLSLNNTVSTVEMFISSVVTICLALSGVPLPSISLYHTNSSGSESRVNTTRYSRIKNCLKFGPVNQQDTGTLTIKATNCFGSSNISLLLNVSIQYTSATLDLYSSEATSTYVKSNSFTEVVTRPTSQEEATTREAVCNSKSL
jgi:hypothetical protein